jgi:hypothetical protein
MTYQQQSQPTEPSAQPKHSKTNSSEILTMEKDILQWAMAIATWSAQEAGAVVWEPLLQGTWDLLDMGCQSTKDMELGMGGWIRVVRVDWAGE